MRLVGHDLHQVHGEELVDLDHVVAVGLLGIDGARFLGGVDDDVAAGAPRAFGLGIRPAARRWRGPRSRLRPANLTEPRALALRLLPRTVLVDLDGEAAGDAEVQIELARRNLPSDANARREIRANGLASDVDHLGAARDGDSRCPTPQSGHPDDDAVARRAGCQCRRSGRRPGSPNTLRRTAPDAHIDRAGTAAQPPRQTSPSSSATSSCFFSG